MLAEEWGLRNFLNINVVYTRKLAPSITCLSLPIYWLDTDMKHGDNIIRDEKMGV
jgi:hypothetical protein